MAKALTLQRLSAYLATLQGLDHSLMLIQYSSPIIIALLLRLAKLRAKVSSSKAIVAIGVPPLTTGLAALGSSIGEARVVMRLFGLVPILSALRQMFPALTPQALLFAPGKVMASVQTTVQAKPVQSAQLAALACYYPLEHAAFLAAKGVLPLGAQRAGKASLWSVRFWALYVILTLYSLSKTRESLIKRTKALRANATLPKSGASTAQAEGYELQEATAEAEAVEHKAKMLAEKKDLGMAWAGWKNALLINAAYAPLTCHWSTIGGLWTNPAITGFFGVVAAVGQIQAGWAKTA